MSTRIRSKIKIRKKVNGTAERPRLTVYRSLNHIYAQLIDDVTGHTLAAASSKDKTLQADIKAAKGKISRSKLVGGSLAEKAKAVNISAVVFDRNGYRYHGRVKAVADGARENGLQF